MSRKALTLAQCRFLGDHLKMEGFERLLAESPLLFLQSLVRNFRFNIPFNVMHIPATMRRTGKVGDTSWIGKCFETSLWVTAVWFL